MKIVIGLLLSVLVFVVVVPDRTIGPRGGRGSGLGGCPPILLCLVTE